MFDREQPHPLRPVESGNVRLRSQYHSTAPIIGVEHMISAPDLTPTDRQTWEDFWSNLLGEYEHLSQDMAEAA